MRGRGAADRGREEGVSAPESYRCLGCDIDQARANGFEQLELGVYSDNSRAIHLYEKFGFERYGIQPRAFKLKDGTYRDEIIMVKML